ncbi:hypothetical protein F5148DRAFT_1181206 [Russula earlei]|uniref:Uncharacterized protein n=1 Tax=Russula earlei TaxID=71964 RepID=A0ACC0UF71_9AGAM|nr:hypothetical protein F5148DRAFT_1181206 [Russula earlei]
MFADRKASFKQPPRHVVDTALSQEVRRRKALEEQKRRRAKLVESERHIDLFAGLHLGLSDDEAENHDSPDIVRGGIAQLAPLLPRPEPAPASVRSQPSHAESNAVVAPEKPTPSKRKGRWKKPAKPSNKKTSPWANKCMYAELLEMQESELCKEDGLPSDLETGWVVLAPVPLGKRCLAISHQGGGLIGAVPNTTIRSRVLGKPLIPRFPSPLPSDTVLDCILDRNWMENGVLHVLDVIKWKGQDIADCESSFRFWWRDTRLSELPPSRPPKMAASHMPSHGSTQECPIGYRFPYPTTFLRIPYYTNTTFAHFLTTIIPRARSSYRAQVSIPTASNEQDAMDIESSQFTGPAPRTAQVEINPDGLLLYVAQAIYEPGTSPLSSWVPLVAPVSDEMAGTEQLSPLVIFERLIQRRLAGNVRSINEVDMLPAII